MDKIRPTRRAASIEEFDAWVKAGMFDESKPSTANPHREYIGRHVDHAKMQTERDLRLIADAFGRIEANKRFIPDEVGSLIWYLQARVIEAQQLLNSYYWSLWREQVIAEHGPEMGTKDDFFDKDKRRPYDASEEIAP